MKIINVNYADDNSGSSIAAKRINKMLIKNGFDSKLVLFNNNNFETINIKIRKLFNRVLKKFIKNFFLINNEYSINFGLIPSNFYRKINNANSEIINLHWLGNEIISIKQISKINGRIIWTLHDMWPYSAIEHYIEEKKFKKNYLTNKSKLNFFLKFIINSKVKHFKNVKLIICTSEWQKKMVELSPVFRSAKKVLIPLPLNFDNWVPEEKKISRKFLNINNQKKTILFISSHKYAHKRKGLRYVLEYLENTSRDDLIFLTLNCEKINLKNKNIKHINFNDVNNRRTKINIYSSADVFLMPSEIESFGQTALEAHACDCPIVTFKNTGSQDIVDHLKTGYISNYLDYSDFKKGIEWTLSNDFSKNYIRSYAKNRFSEEVIIKKYKNLVKDLI